MRENRDMPEGERRGEVAIEMVQLDSAIEKIHSHIWELVTVMEPITRPNNIATCCSEDPKLDELCPHADRLRTFKLRIQSLIQTLVELLEYQEL